MSRPRPDRRPASAAAVVAVCALMLAAGYLAKDCPGLGRFRLSFLCHSDIYSLYGPRAMDRAIVPYVLGRLEVIVVDGDPLTYELHAVDGANEYPVLTGLLMWAPSPFVSANRSYLGLSAAMLAPFGLATALLLAWMTGRRAYLFAASPLLVLYAFHNWDLAAVAAATAGCWCWWRGRDPWAAVWFGVGGALKLYPLLFLVALALEARRRAGIRPAMRAFAIGVGAFVAVNLPILLASPAGWAVPFRFHSLRPPNYDSLWGVLANLVPMGVGTIDALSGLLVIAGVAAVLVAAERRARRDGAYPFLPACAALLAAFLLANKVHSPQYALWLLPWFSLVLVRFRWYVALVVTNLVLYAAIFGVSVYSVAARDTIVFWSVWARLLLMGGLLVAFLRAEPVESRAAPGD
jgi:uncharacterized membrane protein